MGTGNHQSHRTAAGADDSSRVVCITVEDDGPGLSEEAREHLFEPFFTTKGEAGHGFGLPQVYGFMRQSGGDIRIESKPGVGTRVHLWFPAVAEAAADRREAGA
jgi:signal transduction histidine kinase